MTGHVLTDLSAQVELDYPGLGDTVAFSLVSMKARQCLLLVAFAGMGKSTVSACLEQLIPSVVVLDTQTEAGFQSVSNTLEHFEGAVITDDIGKIGSDYMRLATLTAWPELAYSHKMVRHSALAHITIEGFNGGVLMNIQPPLLKWVALQDRWENLIRDKTVRYYHLYRPQSPNSVRPELDELWGEDLDSVYNPTPDRDKHRALYQAGLTQWSTSRSSERVDLMLRAIAALDNSEFVRGCDYDILCNLIKPLMLERHLVVKKSFTGPTRLDDNALAILTEYATHQRVNLLNFVEDFKVTKAQAEHILGERSDYFVKVGRNPIRFERTSKVAEQLAEAGVQYFIDEIISKKEKINEQ